MLISFIRILTTILDIAILLSLAYFIRPLRWARYDDRPSLIGFGMMIAAILMDIVLIWV